ncbi:MAG: acyl-CoA dehydrogenase [Gammaproteobacteria bacterium]|jgi:3-methylfumaryl-CoA hydratase|nr:acyl-CoA dehydrogenase [Gammaproteobacteria bacterium]MCP4881507.1 acyl-CoA dehydrogenase [Gammaproteobacteria bacterium]MDP6165601.1 MaoC family dehydratase N-terminal domain-containing protein [Gammaproteobacteria bacterium]
MTDVMSWIGKQEIVQEQLDPQRVRQLATTLNRPMKCQVGEQLPALWHWIITVAAIPIDQLGRDGHAQKGLFLPPVDLPRRMWAGGRFEFRQALTLGEQVTRTSTIEDIQYKQGRSGELAFVTVSHRMEDGLGGYVYEEHDIVYRQDAKPKGPASVANEPLLDAQQSQWQMTIKADPVMLFRYSALTFNGHRIHYDREYAAFEGYAGLVVHGPMVATYMLELVREHLPRSKITQFAFRALRPIVDYQAFTVHGCQQGSKVLVWATDDLGQRAMQGEADLEN